MELITKLKKLASILLLLCLFLPLSQCTQHTGDGKKTTTVHYGHQILIDSAIETFDNGFDWEALLGTFIFFSFIFAPLVSLAFRNPTQQIIAILFAFPASLTNYVHIVVFTPRIGIWCATLLWALIVIASLIELYRYIKQRRNNNK